MRERRRMSTGTERRISIDLRASPREKVSEKKGEKKDRKARHDPNPMKTFWVIVNSSMRQSTIPLIGEWREEREQYYSRGWSGDGRRGLAAVRVSRSLRFRRFSDSLCRVYDREKLSIGLKGSPGCKLRSFPRKNSLISVDSVRKRESVA